MSTLETSDKWKELALNTKSPWLRKQYQDEVKKSVISENMRDRTMGRLRNPNIPTGADAMRVDKNATENKMRYKELKDLDVQLLEKLKKDSKRPALRRLTTMALGRKIGKACKLEGTKAKLENRRSCLISEINEALPDEDKSDFKRLRELTDELIEEHIRQYKEVGELMNMRIGKGLRMKKEMEVYERNIGVGEEKNVGIFMKNIQKEERCEEKIDNILKKHQKELRQHGEEKRYLYRQLEKREKELKKCSGELKDGKTKARVYVEKMRKRIAELETYEKAIKNKLGGRKKWTRKYKRSINCRRPKGYSQKQYCKYGRKKRKTRKKGGGVKRTRKIYGPKYNQKKWLPKYVKKSHNCYSYLMDNINKESVRECRRGKYLRNRKGKSKEDRCFLPQPGNVSGYPPLGDKIWGKKKELCRKLNKRVLSDNKGIFNTTKKGECPKNHYKGAMFVGSKRGDYHFYRRDRGGLWSHKFGRGKPVRVDTDGKLIKDPEKAKKEYKRAPGFSGKRAELCKYYCLPMDRRKRKISLRSKKRKTRRKSVRRRKKRKKRKR